MPSESSYKVHRPAKSGGSRRDSSPDSIIFTPESNLSLFSSASVSVDRCSSTSDAHDRDDSLISGPSLERDQRVSSSCKDLDLDKRGTGWKNSCNSRKSNKVKAWKEEFEVKKDDESQNLDSARSSFSVALRECQERRSRSEALAKKLDYQRTVSLDLSNVTSTSPRVVNVKRASVSTNKSSVFPSPGTPTYLHSMQKGWSSERVPLRSNGGRSPPNAGFLPLYSGRTVPSKWEDAERWIVSPLAKEGAARTSFGASHERRPKAKSGPLGPPGFAYYSLYSPAVPMVHGGNMGGLTASSPFSAGVLPETVSSRGSTTAAFPQRIDPSMARSVSIHGCSETLASSSQDDIHESMKDAATDAQAVSRRDMATQMSPEGSIRFSPERQCSFSPSSPSPLPISELLNAHSNRAEVKDLQVDEKVTVTRWSKKHRGLYHGNGSKMRDHVHGKATNHEDLTCATEEARIISWENLQKAKAEAAIRKLEMKLEKKRSSSMEKIMRKVKSAEKRAEEMRRSVLDNRVSTASHGKASSFKRSGKKKIPSLSGCFTCHVF
ncbi:Remorin family protein [Arabidopsis thaliana]|uniref:Remorin family protein n=1 Tax=Arabidopsis thaliana TaxID=3702 RepID=A0A1P8AMX7_ARATH|nr:Remorin family protein [Arabidopsis thaliana]ANM58009.1 Remorin family protein [Arabidopsis thaliana]|eukprot:NP_001320478.1 Remorin family protein [Arabidopsis thaliana]